MIGVVYVAASLAAFPLAVSALGVLVPPLTSFVSAHNSSGGFRQVLALGAATALVVVGQLGGEFTWQGLFLSAATAAITTFKSYDWAWARTSITDALAQRGLQLGAGSTFGVLVKTARS